MKTIVTMMSLLLLSAACMAPAEARVLDRTSQTTMMRGAQPGQWEGKAVIGARGESLGSVLAVDQGSRKIELQTAGGVAVSMPASMFVERNDRLMALNTTRRDIMAMAKMQTGRTVALNVDLRHRDFRG